MGPRPGVTTRTEVGERERACHHGMVIIIDGCQESRSNRPPGVRPVGPAGKPPGRDCPSHPAVIPGTSTVTVPVTGGGRRGNGRRHGGRHRGP
jgi:hypothetical protein